MGYVPLMLKPDDFKRRDLDSVFERLKARADEQYGSGGGQRYLKLPLLKRVLLVDELDALDLTSKELIELLGILRKVCDFSIVFGDEFSLLRQVFAAIDMPDLLDYRIYRLLEFDPKQQREMSSKLYECYGNEIDDDERGAILARLDSNLKSVLGEHILTPYAGEVTMILRELLTQSNSGAQNGAYGFYYDTQIKSDIACALKGSKETQQPQADLIELFLAELAIDLFRLETFVASDATIDMVVERLRTQKHRIYRESLLNVLQSARLLVKRDGGYSFRERYQRLFYLAQNIRNLLNDDRSREAGQEFLLELINTIHERESADVVLFTVYLTANPWLLDQLSKRASMIFPDEEECDMDKHFAFIQKSRDSVTEATIRPKIGHMGELDSEILIDEDADFSTYSEEDLEDLLNDTIREMNRAFNTLNILGLAVRNYPAKIDVSLREEIVSSGYSLSLRALSAFMTLVRKGNKELELLAKRHLKVNARHAGVDIAARLVSICSFGAIRRATQAFASPHLELVLQSVWENDTRVSARMLRFSVLLDLRRAGQHEADRLYKTLDENDMAKVVLGFVVQNHLRVFRASNDRIKKLSSAVGLDPNSITIFHDPVKPKSVGKQ
jgi:hypothetical protein